MKDELKFIHHPSSFEDLAMEAFYRGLGGLFLLGTVGAALYAGSRDWQGSKPGFWDVVTPACEMGEEQRRYEELQTEREIALARLEGKQRITEEVIGRRLTLVEAAARFRALHASWLKHSWDHLTLQNCAGASEEERWCRHVIAYVNGTLKGSPDSAAI